MKIINKSKLNDETYRYDLQIVPLNQYLFASIVESFEGTAFHSNNFQKNKENLSMYVVADKVSFFEELFDNLKNNL